MSDSKFLNQDIQQFIVRNVTVFMFCQLLCADIPRPTVQQLLRELNDVDWYLLGGVLGLSTAKLQGIKSSNSSGVHHWKIDMFQSWLDSTPTASWQDVIKALEQLDHKVLAARLRAEYIGPQLPGVYYVYIRAVHVRVCVCVCMC